MKDIASWLSENGLAKHGETFRANAIDFDILPALDESQLKELGLPLGDRVRLLRAIAQLAETAPAPELQKSTSSAPSPSAERRQLTVLFVDLVDSTALSQALDPEDLRDVMRCYHEAVAGVIREAGGFVAKFMGDGVLAYFGYPQASEDAAERAVRASLQAVSAVKALPHAQDHALSARAGVATGPVVVGDVMGDDIAREVNVVGETPNLAARLLGLGKPGSVVIAESTRRIVGDLFILTALGSQPVKGMAEPVPAFEVTGERHGISRFEATRNAERSRFVGRGQEVNLLLDRWEQAKTGDGQLVLLSGEAGIGKSRITETMALQIQADSHHRVRYQCTPQHTNSPLYPVLTQLAGIAGIEPEDDAAVRAARIGRAMPDSSEEQAVLVASLLGAPLPEGSPLAALTPARRRQHTLDAFTAQLDALCRQRPLLLVIEDAHWLDPTTTELIAHLVEKAPTQRLLIVVTYRPDYRPPWLSAPIATQLVLNRLSRTHASTMLEGLGSGKAVPPEAVEYIIARSDGVPLYMEELFKALCDSGALRETGTAFELARPLDGTAVPATLQDSLMARLDRLAPAKAVAQLGAAIGREFDFELLSAISGMQPAALQEGLDQLLGAGLIFARGQTPATTYTFKHALVQDAAYSSMLKARRLATHSQIAEALIERQADIEPEVVARHLERAGNARKAIEWWEKAGDAASYASASGEAIAHYGFGVSLHDESAIDPTTRRQHAKLCQKLAAILMQTEGFQSTRAISFYEESRKISLDARDADTFVKASIALWSNHCQAGHYESALALFEGLSDSTLSDVSAATSAKFLRARGTVRYCLGRFADAHADFVSAFQTADSLQLDTQHSLLVGDPAISGRVYAVRTLMALGWPAQMLEIARQGSKLARERGHAFDIEWGLQGLGRANLWSRRYAEAADAFAEARSICEQHGFESHLGSVLTSYGVAQVGLGDTARGLVDFDRGLELWVQTTGPIHQQLHLVDMVNVCLIREEFGLAERYLADAEASFKKVAEPAHTSELLRLRGLLCAIRHDEKEAVSKLREAFAVADGQQANGFKLRAARDLARVLAQNGKVAGAQEVLAPIYAWFTEGFDTPDLKESKALLDELTQRTELPT